MLNQIQVSEIYQAKIAFLSAKISLQPFKQSQSLRSLIRGHSTEIQQISKRFKITSRTVRDIWNRRTWACATKDLWPEEYQFDVILPQENDQVQ